MLKATEVTISRGFWMGKYEVTQGEYLAVLASNPSGFRGDANRPVEQVTWFDASQRTRPVQTLARISRPVTFFGIRSRKILRMLNAAEVAFSWYAVTWSAPESLAKRSSAHKRDGEGSALSEQ
ncbi:MAG: SUMF1/EgtB/PvdO family nonheme iron enzyme [Verrucomicrobiia bacterium]